MTQEPVERPISNIIVQLTPFCNINCAYCYLPDRSNTSKIAPELLGKTVERLFQYQGDQQPITWNWHAGEPLAVGYSYLRCHR